MTPELEEALGELFEVDSPLYRDVRGLMELAIQSERERFRRDGMPSPEAPQTIADRVQAATAAGDCIPCSGCGGMRRENCKDFPRHAHEWCDCQ